MRMPATSQLLTVREMAEADRLAVDDGDTFPLMEAAGRAAARVIQRRFAPTTAVVLCGPGNNGGDGFVIARYLAESGWPVRVGTLGGGRAGDAVRAAELWTGVTTAAGPQLLSDAGLVVDALFGAGLNRDIGAGAAYLVQAMAGASAPRVAIDVPSGVDGDTGQVRGVAAPATLTVGFFRGRPGHFLLPGRDLCGTVRIVDIGIPGRVLETIAPRQARNLPGVWKQHLPSAALTDHKYRRGHALVVGGERMTGAARFATAAARRIGCGMVTLVVPGPAEAVYRATVPGALVRPLEGAGEVRFTAMLAGPGMGTGPEGRDAVVSLLARGAPAVLDADALTLFADAADDLAAAIRGPLVVTPHEGEFARLFPDLADHGSGKMHRARAAADRLGAVVVLKGADTVIAAPGGDLLINANAPAWLATGGTGDVLAGTITGLLAQGMPAAEAAAAAVWLNGAAALAAGPGLLAEDLPDLLPAARAAACPRSDRDGG